MGIYAIFLYGYILSERLRKIGGTVASLAARRLRLRFPPQASTPRCGLGMFLLWLCVCVCVVGSLGEWFQESDQRHAKLRLSGNSNLWTKTKLFTLTLAAGKCTSASTTLSAGHVVIRSGYQCQVGIGIGSTLARWGTFFSFSFVLVCASAAETKGPIGQNFNDVSDLNLARYLIGIRSIPKHAKSHTSSGDRKCISRWMDLTSANMKNILKTLWYLHINSLNCSLKKQKKTIKNSEIKIGYRCRGAATGQVFPH